MEQNGEGDNGWDDSSPINGTIILNIMLKNITIMLNNITIYYVEYQVQNKGWDIWAILRTSLPPVGTMSQVQPIFDFATFPKWT